MTIKADTSSEIAEEDEEEDSSDTSPELAVNEQFPKMEQKSN